MKLIDHLGHFSPSSLILGIQAPGIWAQRYFGGARELGNVKMWRGSAVEAGFVSALCSTDDRPEREAAYVLGVAAHQYWLNVDENNARGPEADEQAALIEPMLAQCLKWQPPSALNAAQVKVEHYFDDVPVPVIGYLDLSFEGVDVDLKTTMRLPSAPRLEHVYQVSFYRAARHNKPGGLLYVTDKKHAYYEVTNEMMDGALAELTEAAQKLCKLLAAFDTPEDLMGALPIDYSNYRAPKKGALRAASASDDFTAVEIETR